MNQEYDSRYSNFGFRVPADAIKRFITQDTTAKYLRIYFTLPRPQNTINGQIISLPNLALTLLNNNCEDDSSTRFYEITSPDTAPPLLGTPANIEIIQPEDLKEQSSHWQSYITQNQHHVTVEKPSKFMVNWKLVPVRYYTMETSILKNFLTADNIDFTFVAVTESHSFESREKREYEGFIRLDLLIDGPKIFLQGAPSLQVPNNIEEYDFALPCPQNC